MGIELQPISIDTGCADSEGFLALADGKLVAVFVELRDPTHDEMQGRWFLEAGFGPCATRAQPYFASPAELVAWIHRRLG